MSPRLIKTICVSALCFGGAVWVSLNTSQRPPSQSPASPTRVINAQPHFLARCVVLWKCPNYDANALDVEGIVISPNGRAVAAWVESPDPMIDLSPLFWEVATKKSLSYSPTRYKWFIHGNVDGVHQTRAGLTGVVGEKDFVLRKIKSGEVVRRFQTPTKDHCTAWTFSPDGKTLWWADKQQRIFWQSIA